MTNVLLLGARGLLGQTFVATFRNDIISVVSRDRLDIRFPGSIRELITSSECDWVVNCAAHTDVEAAENDPAAAYAANALLPGMLAAACRERDVLLVHISSTGCYGAAKRDPYTEADLPQPTTVHHRSKIAGENAVRFAHGRHLIIRTGWLFGGNPANPRDFVWKRLLEASGASSIICDPHQVGCPTYSLDAALQISRMARAGLEGTFNLVSSGFASRFEYIARIVQMSGLECEVKPSLHRFTRKAPVSANEAAVNWNLQLMGMDGMPTWESGLERHISELKLAPAWTLLSSKRTVQAACA